MLNEEGSCNKQTGDGGFSLEHMQTLVGQYQRVVWSWRHLPRMTSVLDVEQRSREMLVMWTAFCLVHQRCVGKFTLCAQYNIALNWKDLEVAVLNDRAAISALQCVARYIRRWNATTMRPPLFHLSNQAPTFDFGRRFGSSSTSMLTVYNREVEAWKSYEVKQWEKIEKKESDVSKYRREIAHLNESLDSTQASLTREKFRLQTGYDSDGDRRYTSRLTRRLNSEIDDICSAIKKTNAILEAALVAPLYLVHPLPPSQDDAIQVIFMLTMPRHLEIMGSLCLTAQRSFAPATATSEMTSLPQRNSTSWQQFYYERAQKRAMTATSVVFTASPSPFTLPRTGGPTSVDNLYNLAQYRIDCVWKPTLGGTVLSWSDAFGVKLDPFTATASSIKLY